MTEFVGVATDEDLLDRDDDQHTIAGNKIRLGNKRLVVREDTGWCDNLTMPELKEIEASCSDLASELGYDLSPEALQQSNPDGPDQ